MAKLRLQHYRSGIFLSGRHAGVQIRLGHITNPSQNEVFSLGPLKQTLACFLGPLSPKVILDRALDLQAIACRRVRSTRHACQALCGALCALDARSSVWPVAAKLATIIE